MATQRPLIIGGSGFLGSAICRTCVSRGWSPLSISRNGEPSYPDSKKPEWAKEVEWIQGSAFDESLLKTIMPSVTSVVHTLGILLESDYKAGGSSLASGISKGFRENLSSIRENANPLASGQPHKKGAYETINRDSALAVLRAYLEARPNYTDSLQEESPFVYISAEDVFRPIIPARYIATKREAEIGIQRLAETARSMMAQGVEEDNEFEDLEEPGRLVRPVMLRPSLIYHPELRPISALPAALLSLSSSIQSRLPIPLRAYTGSSIFSALTSRYSAARPDLPSASESIANLLSIPPVHVDTVAEAVCRSIEIETTRGVIGVEDMEAMIRGRAARSAFGARPQPIA